MAFKKQEEITEKYYRKDMYPTIFCPGCGIGQVMNYASRALDELEIDVEDIILVSGIGCSSRIPAYYKTSGVHTTHGRAIPFATGIKLSLPEKKVIVFTGDGDCIGIGGNHFLHGIRRNMDITVIVVNNFTYGMTGGQVSPTTLKGSYTTTTQYGNIEPPLAIFRLAALLGAPFVARWTTAHPVQAIDSMKKAINKRGFSVVEMLSPCPTNYGRKNKQKSAVDSNEFFKNDTLMYSEKFKDMPMAEYKKMMEENIVIGEIQDFDKPTFLDNWEKMVTAFEKK